MVTTTVYSVTQSYANSFWGDVVLDTFNNVSRDEDNILDQIYKKQICPNFILMIFDFHNLYENAYYHWIITKTQFYELFLVESCISLNIHFLQSLKFLNPQLKSEHIWSNMLSSSLDTLLKVSKTTSPLKLFAYDCVTLYILISIMTGQELIGRKVYILYLKLFSNILSLIWPWVAYLSLD